MIHFLASVNATFKLLERECFKCGHKQVTKPSQKQEVVSYNHCGHALPPKAGIASRGTKLDTR
jgi:ribosomal protein S27E